MKLIPINKGKRRKTRYNSCRTENKTLTHRKIKLRIKETIFLFIRNKHTHTHTKHTTLSQQAENENKNTDTKQIKLYKTDNNQKTTCITFKQQHAKQNTHTLSNPNQGRNQQKTKKNNCQNKIRTIVFNKNDNKPVFSL